ncbi:MAG: hypothetical protein ACRBN8_03995 [Nannocystales bacterium]
MTWTRRRFVVRAAQTAATVPLAGLAACSGDGGGSGADASTGGEGSSSTSSGPGSAAGGSTGTSEGSDASGSTSASTSAASSDSSTGAGGSSDTGSGGGSESEGSTGAAVCDPSPEDIEGPFYRPEIPIGGDLDVHGDVGVALRIEGVVRGEDCAPIAGAVVEIWHATPVAPDGEPGDNDATYDSSDAYRYYGQVATDERGRYAFTTLRPGWYLNGPEYRPAHVHVKVWVQGTERLTSQLYFEGDPFNDGDAWFNPVMALEPDEAGLANIDFVV